VNLAKSNLRDFSFGGFQGGSGTYKSAFNFSFYVVLLFLGETLLYITLQTWASKRLFRAAWGEIAAGRWTPPKVARPFPTAIKVLFGLLALSLACTVLAGIQGQRDQQYAMLLAYGSLGIVLIFVLERHSRRQIQQARERGLWPHLGEPPTPEHVRRLAQAGEKILAIKLYRQIHRVSLADAKAAVEKLAG
jgi:hypothetical protein